MMIKTLIHFFQKELKKNLKINIEIDKVYLDKDSSIKKIKR